MKRFVFAGLFIVLGFIILGVATANLMRGPDKPEKPRMAGPAQSDTHKTGGRGATADTNAVQPPSLRPAQPTAAAPQPLPGMPVPLTTTVQPPTVRPPAPEMSQHVPVIQPTDLGTPSSPTAGRQHQ